MNLPCNHLFKVYFFMFYLTHGIQKGNVYFIASNMSLINEAGHSIAFKIVCVSTKTQINFRWPLWIVTYPESALRRFCSDCAVAQVDLSLRWTHMQ